MCEVTGNTVCSGDFDPVDLQQLYAESYGEYSRRVRTMEHSSVDCTAAGRSSSTTRPKYRTEAELSVLTTRPPGHDYDSSSSVSIHSGPTSPAPLYQRTTELMPQRQGNDWTMICRTQIYPSLIRRPRCLGSLWNFLLKLTVRKLESCGYPPVKTA